MQYKTKQSIKSFFITLAFLILTPLAAFGAWDTYVMYVTPKSIQPEIVSTKPGEVVILSYVPQGSLLRCAKSWYDREYRIYRVKKGKMDLVKLETEKYEYSFKPFGKCTHSIKRKTFTFLD